MWGEAEAYEDYVGRWSRRVAREFVAWLAVPPGQSWLDVGCGPGALTAKIDAATTTGVDFSPAFLSTAKSAARDASFVAGDAAALPLKTGTFDVVVSGLALNFVPEPGRAVREFARVAAPGGLIAAYVWDYAGGMRMMRHFWDAAIAVDPAAAELDEGARFPICRDGALGEAWERAGLRDVTSRAITVPTPFASFEDYWRPFLGGQGPAPAYLSSLSASHRHAVRERLRELLPARPDGSIDLTASAWAAKGRKA